MANDLLFCVVKEFGKRKTGKAEIAGKIFQIKILSGSLSVGDEVSLYSVDLDNPKRKCGFNKLDGTIKEIKRLDSEVNEFEEVANRGDIVTINLSKQCTVDGKKVDRNDIVTKNSTIGVSHDEPCDGVDLLRLRFKRLKKCLVCKNCKKCRIFTERLRASLDKERKSYKNGVKTQPRACIVSLLWFGKKIAAEVVSVADDVDAVVCFKLLNNQTLPIPKNSELRKHIMHVVVKDHYCTEQRGRNKPGEAKWKYYSGDIVFDN
jgi:hypothetical protein